MQKPPVSSPENPSPPSPIDQIFERARKSFEADSATLAGFGASLGGAIDSAAERVLEPGEILRAVREPIDWLLTIVHRLTSGDPDDMAAVDRVRTAFHARLLGLPIRVRLSDVLTLCGILVSALDPAVVVRAVTDSVSEGVSAALGSPGGRSLAAHLAYVAGAFSSGGPRSPSVVRRQSRRSPTGR